MIRKNIKTLDLNTKLYEFLEKKENKEKILNTLIKNPEVANFIKK